MYQFVCPYGLCGWNALWFMCWFWRYINCLFVYLINFLPHFIPSLLLSLCFLSYLFTSLLVYFLTYLFTPSRTDPFHFQAGGHRRRPNLALVFCVLILCCSIFFTDVCLLWLCLFSFFSTKPRDWLGRTSPKWPIVCRVGRRTLTQLINCQFICLLLSVPQTVVRVSVSGFYSIEILQFYDYYYLKQKHQLWAMHNWRSPLCDVIDILFFWSLPASSYEAVIEEHIERPLKYLTKWRSVCMQNGGCQCISWFIGVQNTDVE